MAAKKGRKSAKKSAKRQRGAQPGNTNRRGTQKTVTTPQIEAGTENDQVMQGFSAKREQLAEQRALIDSKMGRLEAAQQAYVAAIMGDEAGEMQAHSGTTRIPRNVPRTGKGTPDLRTVAGREFVAQHPEFQAAPRAD